MSEKQLSRHSAAQTYSVVGCIAHLPTRVLTVFRRIVRIKQPWTVFSILHNFIIALYVFVLRIFVEYDFALSSSAAERAKFFLMGDILKSDMARLHSW